jgi:hypothetical protein
VPYGIGMNMLHPCIVSGSMVGEPKEGVARLRFANAISFNAGGGTMINNSSLKKFKRLAQKHLTTQLVNELIAGLQCSPFEAKAIVETVHTIYAPYFQSNGSLKPGQMLFPVVGVENAPSVPLARCKQLTVTLTLDDPTEDLPIRERDGVIALRRHRMQRMCTEAFQQGGILTVEDLANRLLNCGERTICRDLNALRKKNIIVPLRSTVTDMGRTLSHRSLIIKLWLSGKEYSDIARESFHSVTSVNNYVDKFKRVVALSRENYDIHTISFLVKLSAPLVEEYFKLYRKNKIVSHRRKELQSFLKKSPRDSAGGTIQGDHSHAR